MIDRHEKLSRGDWVVIGVWLAVIAFAIGIAVWVGVLG